MSKKSRIISIDTETTGLDVHNSRIVEIACVVLHPNYEVDMSIQPFVRLVNPGKVALYAPDAEGAFKVNKLNREQILLEGIGYEECKHQFIGWLGGFADICDPMGQNWMLDAGMIRTMFGHADYEKYFSRKVRDPKIIAQFVNDARPGSFVNTSLNRIADALGIKFEGEAHRAYNDAIVTAKVYSALTRRLGLSEWSLDDTKPEAANQSSEK
jgi:DNA polymerase III epsilon subunit-like protein